MSTFNFKHFKINQNNSALKVGTDAFLLGALTQFKHVKTVLDIGSGTGVLALIAAQFNSTCKVIALEIDPISCLLSQKNFEQSKWSERLEAKPINFLDFDIQENFDLIISNPPYFENSTQTTSARKNLARHNNSLTADKLFKKVSLALAEDGSFWCILPFDHSNSYLLESIKNNLFITEKIEIFGKPNTLRRYVYCFKKKQQPLTVRKITVRNAEGNYTEEYKVLTKELHDRAL